MLTQRLHTVGAGIVVATLAACANWQADNDASDPGELLRNGLPVAAAALAAGQLDVAGRLYRSLSERFDDAPEPFLGLGYIAFQGGDSASAETYFLQAADRAADTPALKAEALLGAGRTALVRGRTEAARRHFRDARTPGRDTSLAPWIANGLAVAAALEADYEAAQAHYAEALRLSPDNRRFTANYVRMLVAAGRVDDAARTYALHPPSWWPDDDGPDLSRLIEQGRSDRGDRTDRTDRTPAAPRAEAPHTAATDESRPGEDVASGQTGPDSPPRPPPDPSASGAGQRVPSLAPPRPLDPDLAMRLYLSDALPAQAQAHADTRNGARVASPDGTGLMLHLDGWPDLPAPPAPGDDTPPPAGVAASGVANRHPPPEHETPPPTPRDESLPNLGDQPGLPALPAAGEDPPHPAGAAVSGVANRYPPPEHETPSPTPRDESPPNLDGRPGLPATPTAGDDDAPRSTGVTGPGVAHPFSPPEPGTAAVAPRDDPPPTALTLVLGQSRRMHLEFDATTVLVASPEVADVRLLAPDVLYVIGKGVGRTSVAVLAEDDRIEERVVSVVLDLEPLRTILADEPNLRDVRARRLSRGMALTGEVVSATAVDRALRLAAGALPEGVPIENDLRIASPQQVNLEVQIAEVHRSVTEDLGVNWESFGAEGSGNFGFRIGRPFQSVAGSTPTGLDGFPPQTIDGSPASSIFLGSQGPLGQFRLMIDALSTAGLANVLARPNVTAVSGESASFFSGGERPIPAGFDRDSNTILYEYKKVGVLLDFVPTVLDTGRIVLTVRPEVSEPDASQPLVIGPVALPVINVRRAETTVEVGNGESIVIAGLFRNQSSTTESGVPVLKDVPLLGLLFGTSSIRSDELELIVIVTARLVQPNTAFDESDPPPDNLRVNDYHY